MGKRKQPSPKSASEVALKGGMQTVLTHPQAQERTPPTQPPTRANELAELRAEARQEQPKRSKAEPKC